jgi:excisionase family DNA binding protein
MTIVELAHYLKVSVSCLYKNKKKIPHGKVGSMYRFYKPAIDAWMAEGGSLDGELASKAATAILDSCKT